MVDPLSEAAFVAFDPGVSETRFAKVGSSVSAVAEVVAGRRQLPLQVEHCLQRRSRESPVSSRRRKFQDR